MSETTQLEEKLVQFTFRHNCGETVEYEVNVIHEGKLLDERKLRLYLEEWASGTQCWRCMFDTQVDEFTRNVII